MNFLIMVSPFHLFRFISCLATVTVFCLLTGSAFGAGVVYSKSGQAYQYTEIEDQGEMIRLEVDQGSIVVPKALFHPKSLEQALGTVKKENPAPEAPAAVESTESPAPNLPEPAEANSLSQNRPDLRGLLSKYCYECHGDQKAEQDVNYEAMTDAALLSDGELLDVSHFMIEANEMPPAKATPLASLDRAEILRGFEHALAALRNARPGDPGVVVAPRINHNEYDYVVRDLTGLNLGLGKLLVPDNQAGEGFVNVGAAQNMTVGQFEAYLSTAKMLVRHAVITPESGIAWQEIPLPMEATTPTGFRNKLAEQWREWHDTQWDEMFEAHQKAVKEKTGMFLGAYFEAAWQYHHRAALGMPNATFDDIAANYEEPLYTTGVREIYEILTENPEQNGLMVEWLSERWHALPKPSSNDRTADRKAIQGLLAFIEEYGEGGDDYKGTLDFEVYSDRAERQQIRGKVHKGTWPYQIDLSKTKGNTLYLVVADAGDGSEGDYGFWENGVVHFKDGTKKPINELRLSTEVVEGAQPEVQGDKWRVKAPSVLKVELPSDAKKFDIDLRMDPAHKETASLQTIILDRPPETTGHIAGRGFPGAQRGGFKQARKTARSVEFIRQLDSTDHKHPRDDYAFGAWPDGYAKYYDIPSQKKEPRGPFGPLPMEMYEHMDAEQLAELERMKQSAIDAAQPALYELSQFLKENGLELAEGVLPSDAQLARLDPGTRGEAERLIEAARQHLAKQKDQVRELLYPFVARAWRQPIDLPVLDPLVGFYDEERAEGASFDGAIKTAMTAALMHPNFLYRFTQRNPNEGERRLTGNELATRLAFTLWGSLPDAELLALGDRLQEDDVLRQQVERMRTDDRIIALAREFASNWLQFSDFSATVNPDPDRFKGFDQVKGDMQREAELFFTDLFKNNRPVTNIIDADYTFLNKNLAQWYGIGGVDHSDFRQVALSGKNRAQRGGIFGMGAVLVKYSEPLRTSPVRRGAWFYEHFLGHHLPSPPANVPAISDDERNEEGQSIREQLEEHRDNPACFSCHDKIDPPGIALEKFDAVGRWREQDLADEPIDDQGKFVSNGLVLDGVEGLRQFVQDQQDVFLNNFCHELLGYCLGRTLEPTDEPLVEQMMQVLKNNEYRPAAALEVIILSNQFRTRRNSNL